jgi:hypothetical protein
MALKFYSDAACTTELSPTEYFIGNGSTTAFTLTKFSGASMSSLYVESKVTLAGFSFSNGVGTGTVADGSVYIGCAAYHQTNSGATNVFRGYVTAGGSNTITIKSPNTNATLGAAYTSGAADDLVLVSYVKQVADVNYLVTGNIITFLATRVRDLVTGAETDSAPAPATGDKIIAYGASTLNVNFGGNYAALHETTSFANVYLKREAGYSYENIQIYSDNITQSLTESSLTATFVAGVGTRAAGTFDAVDSEVGLAVNVNGVYIGTISSNTTTAFTIFDEVTGITSTHAGAAESVTIYPVGEFWISNTSTTDSAQQYRRVLQGGMDSGVTGGSSSVVPAQITTDAVYKLWLQATVPLPSTARNYTENILRVSASEYLV